MNKIKQYFSIFFSNNFPIRFFIWIIGNTFFSFGIAFIISANSGFSTYDAFLQPIRKALDIKHEEYGKILLMPVGILLCIIALILNYIRKKTIRIDYLLGIIYVIIMSFIIDEVLKINIINDISKKTDKSNWSFIERPEALILLFLGIPLFTFGVGIVTACKIMPNAYAILIEEIAITSKKSFKLIQFLFDLVLVTGGTLITIINIYVTAKTNWIQVTHFIGLGTFIILIFQGIFVNYSLVKTRLLIDRINMLFKTKKGKK